MGEIKPKKCKMCGKVFIPETYRHRMCSYECRAMAHKIAVDRTNKKTLERRKAEARAQLKPKECPTCGKEFMPRNGRQVCCDAVCQRIRNNQSIKSWYQEYKQEMETGVKKKVEKKKPKPVSLAEFNAQARAMGMTYGQYEQYLRRKESKNAV